MYKCSDRCTGAKLSALFVPTNQPTDGHTGSLGSFKMVCQRKNTYCLKEQPLEHYPPFLIADLPKTLLFHSRIWSAVVEKLTKNGNDRERNALRSSA